MQLHQFNLQYSPEEDRLRLRLNTTSKEEFRFLLTRRFVRLLWPVLQKLLQRDYQQREPALSYVADHMVAMEKDSVISQANFKESYQDAVERFPLGEEYLLLSRIQVKNVASKNILCLLPTSGQGIEIPANNRFLHAFCKLLKDGVAKADWNLSFAELGDVAMTSKESRTLH